MNCSPNWIESYLDHELDAAQSARLEQHLEECESCRDACDRMRMQKAGINAVAPYYAAPPELRDSIHNALRQAASRQVPPPRRELPWRWLAIAALLLLAVSLAWNLRSSRPRTVEPDMAALVLDSHIRSLLGTHLLDVPSSDQHTVKPWFAGKLDFSPDVKDLAAQGFPLAGGRIEYLAGRPVAALVYRRRLHIINVFVWPATAPEGGDESFSRNGYNLIHWTTGPMTYWAASDVAAADLRKLRSLFR